MSTGGRKLSRIGSYDIVAKLGSGGMADVYLGTKTGAAGFSRPVVVKVIRDSLKDKADVQQMFIDEARLSSRIQHPNVVAVEELGEEDGSFFMVMEYVHGVELAALLRDLAQLRRQLTPDAAVSIACSVADGLHAAHEARDEHGRSLGLVHRDVSPQNIILSANGGVKVIDFGVAKAAYRLHRTEGHKIKGKLRYMSPEQISGDADRRSDLFALGVVLWECLTNRRLFAEDDDMVVLDRIRAGDVPPPSTFSAATPELDAVVMQVLAVNPDDRPQTGRAMRQALQRAVPTAQEFDDAACTALLMATLGGELEDQARRLMVPVQMALSTQEMTTEPAAALQRFTTDWTEAPLNAPVSTPRVRLAPTAAPVEPAKRPSHWLIAAIAGSAVFVGIAGAGLLLMRGSDESAAQPAQTVVPTMPAIAPEPEPESEPVPMDETLEPPVGDPELPDEVDVEASNVEEPVAEQSESMRPRMRASMEASMDPAILDPFAMDQTMTEAEMTDMAEMGMSGFRLIETEDPFGDDF